MALKDILRSYDKIQNKGLPEEVLGVTNMRTKIGISEERINAIVPVARQYISFWRAYPDLFVDMLLEIGGNPSDFHFYFYQRVFLRVAMRYQYVYAVFPRASTIERRQ